MIGKKVIKKGITRPEKSKQKKSEVKPYNTIGKNIGSTTSNKIGNDTDKNKKSVSALGRKPAEGIGKKIASAKEIKPLSGVGKKPVSPQGIKPLSGGKKPASPQGIKPLSGGKKPASPQGINPLSGGGKKPASNKAKKPAGPQGVTPLSAQGKKPGNKPLKRVKLERKGTRGLRFKIMMLVFVPLLVLGITVVFTISTMLSRSTAEQSIANLTSSALTVLTAFNQNAGDYIAGADGSLYKGNYNLSNATDLVASIGEAADIEIMFYSKERCIVSTFADADKTNMKFPKEIVKTCMEEKVDYTSERYNVNGVPSYVAGITVFQERSDEVVGMIVVSADVQSRNASMNNVLSIVELATLIAIIAAAVISFVMVTSITQSIREGIISMETVATGQLQMKINEKLLRRKDEVGNLTNGIVKLVDALRKMIKKSIAQTNKLNEVANNLDETASKTKDSIEKVNAVMTVMTDTADIQYKTSNKVMNNVDELKGMLSNVYNEIQRLDITKTDILLEGGKVKKIVSELMYINEALNNIIKTVNMQIEKTDVSAKKIRKSAELIASFADETNLLALNAAIEANRVGEEGKGFAIVAKQIKELADQSTEVSSNIADEINELVKGSKKTLNSMDEVNTVVGRMNESIDVTDQIFGKINGAIDIMSGNVEVVIDKIQEMESTGAAISNEIDDLKVAANKNSECVSDTSMVANYMNDLFEEAQKIKGVTHELVESMSVFKL